MSGELQKPQFRMMDMPFTNPLVQSWAHNRCPQKLPGIRCCPGVALGTTTLCPQWLKAVSLSRPVGTCPPLSSVSVTAHTSLLSLAGWSQHVLIDRSEFSYYLQISVHLSSVASSLEFNVLVSSTVFLWFWVAFPNVCLLSSAPLLNFPHVFAITWVSLSPFFLTLPLPQK